MKKVPVIIFVLIAVCLCACGAPPAGNGSQGVFSAGVDPLYTQYSLFEGRVLLIPRVTNDVSGGEKTAEYAVVDSEGKIILDYGHDVKSDVSVNGVFAVIRCGSGDGSTCAVINSSGVVVAAPGEYKSVSFGANPDEQSEYGVAVTVEGEYFVVAPDFKDNGTGAAPGIKRVGDAFRSLTQIDETHFDGVGRDGKSVSIAVSENGSLEITG